MKMVLFKMGPDFDELSGQNQGSEEKLAGGQFQPHALSSPLFGTPVIAFPTACVSGVKSVFCHVPTL